MDIQKVLTLIQNRDVQTNLLIFFICVSLIQFFDTKIILGIGLFIFIIILVIALTCLYIYEIYKYTSIYY